jgi:RNA polymerase sigma-70 factor (ECF subfamily)
MLVSDPGQIGVNESGCSFVQLVMAWDQRAWFEALFDETYARSVRAALRLNGDRGVSEELASEALTRAYARVGRLRRHPCPEGWVVRTTINLAIDNARRRMPPVPAESFEETEDTVVLRVALVKALEALPARQRQVLALRYLADFGESEVAATLGVSVGSVKTHLHRGLAALRARWQPDPDSPMEAVLDA